MKKTNMIMAALLVIAMLVSVIPVIEASTPAIGTNDTDAVVSDVTPGNYYNNTTVPTSIDFTASITGLGSNETPFVKVIKGNFSWSGNMTLNSTSSKYECSWTSPAEGLYSYAVWIRNNSGNTTVETRATDNYTIEIDVSGPVIEKPKASVEEGNPVILMITDNASGVKDAEIIVSNGNETVYNNTVNATDGMISFDMSKIDNISVGVMYNYSVSAYDNAGHVTNDSGNFTITADTTPPVISDVPTGVSVKQNMPVNITATVTDTGLGVKGVSINITHPDGTYTTGDMKLYNGTYYFEFTNTSMMGEYNFTINATDGKQSSEYTGSFDVIDGIPPVIKVTTLYTGMKAIFIGNITDNVGVASAKITITQNVSGNVTEVASGDMVLKNYTDDATNTTYTGYVYVFTAPGLGEYNYTIVAEDYKGNNASVSSSFSIVDKEPPVIDETSISYPTDAVEGKEATISVSVTDAFGVASVTITLTHNSQTETYNMTLQDGKYVYTFTPEYGEYVFTIDATDVNGNVAPATQQYRFSVKYAAEPTPSPSPDNPTEAELGSTITISYTVTHPEEVKSVVLYYYIDDNSSNPQSVPMQGSNGTYTADITLPSSGSTLTYWVNVTSNDGTYSTSATQSIKLSEPSKGFEMSTTMLAGIGILLLIIIIAVVMMMKKKPSAAAPEEEPVEEEESPEEESEEEPEEDMEDEELGDDLGEDL